MEKEAVRNKVYKDAEPQEDFINKLLFNSHIAYSELKKLEIIVDNCSSVLAIAMLSFNFGKLSSNKELLNNN